MTVGPNPAGEGFGARRGDVVVCVLAPDGEDVSEATLLNVSATTTDGVNVVGCAGASSAVSAIAAAAPGDVVLVRSGAIVPDAWLDSLSAAARLDLTVATVSALTSSDLHAARAGRAGDRQEAEAVRRSSLTLRPRLEAAGGPCVYVRRSALELVSVAPLEGTADWPSPEFSRACLEAGLAHLLADDVLVEDLRPRRAPLPPTGPVARAVGTARRAVDGLSVVVDARNLTGPLNGTRVHVLELLAALGRSGAATVTAIVPADLDERTEGLLSSWPALSLSRPLAGSSRLAVRRADVVHRPFQIASPAELTTLAAAADRVVISHQDLISYHDPAHFRSPAGWSGYRDMTRLALSLADGVVFFSQHVRDEALAEDLVEEHRAFVVPLGVDHAAVPTGIVPGRPRGSAALVPEGEMILCLGTDFRHKNRLFALRVVHELRSRHDWQGQLVLAGPREVLGSSRDDERAMLVEDPDLARAVVDLGPVSEAEKQWLFARTGLVIYPTVHEGFGLVPFEAAEHGIPCLWASGTALAEFLPPEAAGLVPWDAAAAAERVLELLRDARARQAAVGQVRQVAQTLRWSTTAARLLEVYEEVCRRPPAPAAVRERVGGLMREGVSEEAMRLVGPDGALPEELERPLLALATHPRLGTPVLGAIRGGYEAYRRLKPRGRPDQS